MAVAIDLAGKTALVTGASRGIGAAIARSLHEAGAAVALNHPGQPDAEDASRLAATLNALRPGSALAVEADVADEAAVRRMFALLQREWGGLDFLVNNAGILRDRTLAKMSGEEWRTVVDVNLTGVFHCCRHGLELLRDGGAVVSLGSISGLQGWFGQGNYAAAKAGVQALMRVLAREGARRGIRANAVAPGLVDTAMAASIPEAVRAELLKSVPAGRLASPDEIASVVLFLCSPLASYVSGQTIEVNGGWRG